MTLFRLSKYNFGQPDLPIFGMLHNRSDVPVESPIGQLVICRYEKDLESDIQTAMRSRNQQRLDTLRFLKSAINRVEIDRRVTLDDDGITEVVVRQVKDRRDSIRMFEEGNRTDLVAKEAADLAILEEYMPPQLDEEELNGLIVDVIRQVGAESIRDKGKVMGRLMPQVQGKADGQQVNAIVTRILEQGPPG